MLIGIIFISLYVQKEQPPTPPPPQLPPGSEPPSCSASLSLASTGIDVCTITANLTANNCNNKSYEIKNGGTKCSGTITNDSFSKECSWTVSYGDYRYSLYINDSHIVTKNVINCPETPKKCSDGTLYGSCSITKPLYCSNGSSINKCSFCGCPSGQNCNTVNEKCYTSGGGPGPGPGPGPSKCTDDTIYGSCSATKPLYCDNGNLIDRCSVCGCPADRICNATNENCFTPSICSGSITLNLTPSMIEPDGLVTPSTSGLANCNDKVVYIRKDSCSGTQVSSCTITSGTCTGPSFLSPSTEGLYTYYACIDKNNDDDFNDSGESSSKILSVSEINKTELDNSLEYLRIKGLGVHDMAEYVISKSYLGIQIPSDIKQQIINYFDSNQNQTDGSWKGVNTPMFTTHRVLLAYYILNATPNRSLDSFFSNYDTWEKALAYDKSIHGSFDGRDTYHIIIGWFLYYRTYPTWLNDFFTNVEKDLTWTNSTNSHKRTHILYSYVMARRQFPNLDGIIDETLREQSSDGHWNYQCLSSPREVYCNAIQLVLLQQIIKLYPTHRTAEIQNSIDKSRQWVYDSYNTTTVNDVVMGHFGNSTSIEDALMTGIMSAGINGLMDINIDMTFEDLIKTLKTKSQSYIMDTPVYPVDTVPKPLQGYSEVVFGWFPWSHGITYDGNGKLIRYHMSLTTTWAYFTVLFNGSEYRFSFDVKNYNYSNGVLTLTNGSTKLIIDYHTPHNVTLVYGPGYLTFIATYRGAPLWYSKTLNPEDMLIVPESNGRFGGYDAPIKIVGKIFDGTKITNFNGYGDWEHVWFLGGSWSAPKRLWMIFNDDKYYGAVAELKYLNGTIAWHIGRFGEDGGTPYVFDDYQWLDDGKTLPLSVELKGPIRDAQGNVKGNVDLKTDPQKANSITSYWMLYQNISGSVISDTFNNGTAWAEIRK